MRGYVQSDRTYWMRKRRLDRIISGWAALATVGWGLTTLMLYGIIRQSELPVRHTAADINDIRRDWNCDDNVCTFPGLDYSTPIDRRFHVASPR